MPAVRYVANLMQGIKHYLASTQYWMMRRCMFTATRGGLCRTSEEHEKCHRKYTPVAVARCNAVGWFPPSVSPYQARQTLVQD